MVAYLSLLRFYLVMFISVCAKLIRLGDMEDMRRSILFRRVIWQALRWTSASSFGRWGMKEMGKKGLLFVLDSLTVGCMGPLSAHSIPNQITWIGCCHVCGTPCSPRHFDCSCTIFFPHNYGSSFLSPIDSCIVVSGAYWTAVIDLCCALFPFLSPQEEGLEGDVTIALKGMV